MTEGSYTVSVCVGLCAVCNVCLHEYVYGLTWKMDCHVQTWNLSDETTLSLSGWSGSEERVHMCIQESKTERKYDCECAMLLQEDLTRREPPLGSHFLVRLHLMLGLTQMTTGLQPVQTV